MLYALHFDVEGVYPATYITSLTANAATGENVQIFSSLEEAVQNTTGRVILDGEPYENLHAVNRRPREAMSADFQSALFMLGKLEAVDVSVNAVGGVTKILWEKATTFRENDPTLLAMAAKMGIDLAAVFDEAYKIRDQRRAGAVISDG